MGSIAMDAGMSDYSSSTPGSPTFAPQHSHVPLQSQSAKRSATDAGLKANGARPSKSVKRRASKACQCCRARKVRCNVVEHGAPCTNCRLDEVECIVSESKRKKKWTTGPDVAAINNAQPPFKSGGDFPMAAAPPYAPIHSIPEHTPHAVYQDLGGDAPFNNGDGRTLYNPGVLMSLQRLGQRAGSMSETNPLINRLFSPSGAGTNLPAYIKPLSTRLGTEELSFLEKKGALSIPPPALRDELLRSYAEFMHPYQPMINFQELIKGIDRNDGSYTVSLLLFQAIMFAAVATADIAQLKSAGYATRKDARREFFQKTRILYDFDIEVDRVTLIQALLLMTYWYETPDDLKDSHHWMGIAVSLAHSIGLHRNTEKSNAIDPSRAKLWRRIWWSTYMRDRLIALGMRRPTRIKTTDFDVPMLVLDDFDLEELHDGPSCLPSKCRVLRNAGMQRQLAIMCVEKAKLCIAMSHVLSVQYSVLHNNHGVLSTEGATRTTMMLVAKKLEPEIDEVQSCDKELRQWHENLAEEARYVHPTRRDVESGNQSVVLCRSLVHMMYYATLSALHRPQVLPSSAMQPRVMPPEVIEISRSAVRLAASEITNMANTLDRLDMVGYLPTTGVTFLLPAIIIHLLDIKAPDEATRRMSLKGFCECMQIMAKLRDIYAAADYSSAFLEAAIRKAEIILPQKSEEMKDSRNVIMSSQGLVEAGRRMHLVASTPGSGALTPPPDDLHHNLHQQQQQQQQQQHQHQHQHRQQQRQQQQLQFPNDDDTALSDADIASKLNTYLASTPPESESQTASSGSAGSDGTVSMATAALASLPGAEYEPDFDSLINLDAAGEVWSLEDTAYAAMQGESSGFTMDMDWMKGIRQDEGLVGMGNLEFGGGSAH